MLLVLTLALASATDSGVETGNCRLTVAPGDGFCCLGLVPDDIVLMMHFSGVCMNSLPLEGLGRR